MTRRMKDPMDALCSQGLKRQVLVEAEEAVVPEEYPVRPRYCSCLEHCQSHHIVKVAVLEMEKYD